MRLSDLTAYLDAYLRIREMGDWPGACNGLQAENEGTVSRVAVAVDGCEAVIRQALDHEADLLLVHHGLFWGATTPWTGRTYRKLSLLARGNLAVYSAHLPLDAHPDVGNNAELARLLGVPVASWWGDAHGTPVGVLGRRSVPRDVLATELARALGVSPRVMPFGPAVCDTIGIITGGGGSMIRAAAAAGCDTYITGEGQHHTFFDAEELGLNVLYAGHYATETLGVRALGAHLEVRFGLPWVFLDHPTGL